MQHTDIIAKIRKLLRLSQSSNIHEAVAAAAKVQELLSKYNLERQFIETEDDDAKAHTNPRKTRQRLEGWAYGLAGRVAYAFDCQYYHDKSTGETVFVGVGADAEVCGWMYSYLYKVLLRLASAHLRSPACKRLRLEASRQNARLSYLDGAIDMIGARLRNQKQATPPTLGALVLAKEALIKAAMPDIVEITPKPLKIRDQDWNAGRRSAEDVPLSTPIKHTAPTPLALA